MITFLKFKGILIIVYLKMFIWVGYSFFFLEIGFLVWEFCFIGEYFVGGLLNMFWGIFDFGEFDDGGCIDFWGIVEFGRFVGGGGVVFWVIVDFDKFVSGGGVELGDGFFRCFG